MVSVLRLSLKKPRPAWLIAARYPLKQIKNAGGQGIDRGKGKSAGLRRQVHFFKSNGFLGKVNSRSIRMGIPRLAFGNGLLIWEAMTVFLPLPEVGGCPGPEKAMICPVT